MPVTARAHGPSIPLQQGFPSSLPQAGCAIRFALDLHLSCQESSVAQELGRPSFGLSSYEPQFPIVKKAATDRVPPATAEPVRRVTEGARVISLEGLGLGGTIF